MSHFTVIVELPADTLPAYYEDKVTELLAPFDEDREVPEYRSYWEEARPQDHWSFKHVFGSEHMALVHAEPIAEDDVTWEQFIPAYNARYREDNDDESLVEYDPIKDRAFQMSTYNPDSKWDWWTIGGRWRGYFTAVEKMSSDDVERILLSEKRWMNEGRELKQRACDGGPIRLLDLEAQRLSAEREAIAYADKYDAAIVGTPEPMSWEDVMAVHDSIDEARAFYRDQPRVVATRKLGGFLGSPIDDFKWGRELYIRRAVASAVPAYAYLTQDGNWLSRGDMGWFGMSSDTVESRETYDLQVNSHIASVDPNTVLVLVDCHI